MVDMDTKVQAISAESRRVSDIVARGDLASPVPSCPEWSLRDLVLHLGAVQRSWSAHVARADPSTHEILEVAHPSDADLSGWLSDSTDLLVRALVEAGDDSPCWTWWGDPMTAGAVARHQVQEAAVHRFDAEGAVGPPNPLDLDIAGDGVAEFLEVMIDPDPSVISSPIALHASDTGRSWHVGPAGEPDATVRATTSDLVLVLYGRVGVDDVEIDGDHRAVRSCFATFDSQ